MATRPKPTNTKPNILLIIADDLGWFDVGAYHRGIMGAPTPNIDRIAHEGALLTDCYAQASCTAGRAPFCTSRRSRRFHPGRCRRTSISATWWRRCSRRLPMALKERRVSEDGAVTLTC